MGFLKVFSDITIGLKRYFYYFRSKSVTGCNVTWQVVSDKWQVTSEMWNGVTTEPESRDTGARVREGGDGDSTQYRIISDIDISDPSVTTMQTPAPLQTRLCWSGHWVTETGRSRSRSSSHSAQRWGLVTMPHTRGTSGASHSYSSTSRVIWAQLSPKGLPPWSQWEQSASIWSPGWCHQWSWWPAGGQSQHPGPRWRSWKRCWWWWSNKEKT